MNLYLFEDVFYKFRRFFMVRSEDSSRGGVRAGIDGLIQLDANSRFLFEITFGLMPRRFEPTEEDRVIYEEEDRVSEMYLVTEGSIGVGYNMLGPAQSGKGSGRTTEQIAIKLKKPKSQAIVIGDHYVLNKKRC
jgi:hypothetical protein